jgi:hypothetical protein
MKPLPIEQCPATMPARPVTQKDVRALVRHYGLTAPRGTEKHWRSNWVRRCLAEIAHHYWQHGNYGPRDDDGTMTGWARDEYARSVAADGILYTVGTGRDAYGLARYLWSLDQYGVMLLVEQVARAIGRQPGRLATGYVVDAVNSHPMVVGWGLAEGFEYPAYYRARQEEYWTGIVPLTQWPIHTLYAAR